MPNETPVFTDLKAFLESQNEVGWVAVPGYLTKCVKIRYKGQVTGAVKVITIKERDDGGKGRVQNAP